MVERFDVFNWFLTVYSLSICFSDFFLPDLNIFDNRWHYMCIRGPYDGSWRYSLGLWKIRIAVSRHKDLDIQPGSTLRIGITSENSIGGVRETVIGHLSQFNIWDVIKDFTFILKTSSTCRGAVGTVIPWSVVQFWLHDSVTINSPSGCTSAGIYMLSKYVHLSLGDL